MTHGDENLAALDTLSNDEIADALSALSHDGALIILTNSSAAKQAEIIGGVGMRVRAGGFGATWREAFGAAYLDYELKCEAVRRLGGHG